jgi:hypothetical protein
VILGYSITAGLVVLIITLCYLISHDPRDDPFRRKDEISNPDGVVQFHPNTVDVYFLEITRGYTTYILEKLGVTSKITRPKPLLAKSFIKVRKKVSKLSNPPNNPY